MDETVRNTLFEDFAGIPTEAWEEKIKADLKGADYRKKLVWQSDEGIAVKPYYRKEDLEGLSWMENAGTQDPTGRDGQTWTICQDIEPGKDIAASNSRILSALGGGARAIRLNLAGATVVNKELISSLLKDVRLAETEIFFQGFLGADAIFEYVQEIVRDREYDPTIISGCLGADPLGKMASTGIPVVSFDNLTRLMREAKISLPGMKLIDVNGSLFQEAGATLAEELAFTLAMGSEYLAILGSKGLDAEDICKSIQVNMSTGPNYFMEIAKLRAFRLLWDKVSEAYGATPGKGQVLIHAGTSRWNMTLYDHQVNMLRGTTAAMSAILGGADIISVLPFDHPYGRGNEFSDRIARNVQIILRDEAYFGKVMDPSAGSYYIETLTGELAEKAWGLFREIEEMKGFRKAFEKGWIQERLESSRQKKLERATSGSDHILGTNAFPEFNELIRNQLTSKAGEELGGTSMEAIRPFRLASEFEELRQETEASNQRPGVFLFKHGNPAWVSARASFSSNFFACAGYEIIDHPPVDSIEAGLEAVSSSEARIVVLCSSDDAYADLAPAVHEKLGDSAILVVAGYPKDSIDELKATGIEHFIHVRSHMLNTLKIFNKLLGITTL